MKYKIHVAMELALFCMNKIKHETRVFGSTCSWKAELLRAIKYRDNPMFKKSLSCKLLEEYSQEAWLCAPFLRYSLSATSRDRILD